MMQNPKYRYFKSIGILLSSGISFLFALIAYIITAINGYYPDDYGVSFLYGNKDLLVITMVFFVVTLLSVLLLMNVLKKKKTQEQLFPIFLTAASAIFGMFMLSSVLKPIVEGNAVVDLAYIISIVSTLLALAAAIFGGIIISNIFQKKAAYQSYVFSYVLVACFVLSIGLYAITSGILLIKDDALVGSFYLVIALFEILGALPMLYGISDPRLR